MIFCDTMESGQGRRAGPAGPLRLLFCDRESEPAMGTVHPIRDQSHMALGSAVEAFLVTLDHPESWGTRRVYASTLRALRAEFGDATDTGTLEPGLVAAWFTRQWGQAAPPPGTATLTRSAQRSATGKTKAG